MYIFTYFDISAISQDPGTTLDRFDSGKNTTNLPTPQLSVVNWENKHINKNLAEWSWVVEI